MTGAPLSAMHNSFPQGIVSGHDPRVWRGLTPSRKFPTVSGKIADARLVTRHPTNRSSTTEAQGRRSRNQCNPIQFLQKGAKVAEIFNKYLCFALSACSSKNWIGSFGCGFAALRLRGSIPTTELGITAPYRGRQAALRRSEFSRADVRSPTALQFRFAPC